MGLLCKVPAFSKAPSQLTQVETRKNFRLHYVGV